MKPLDLIQQLDNKSNFERLDIIIQQLDALGVGYSKHRYFSGTNLIVDLGKADKRIGVSSHFDRVRNSGGANDNASAVAVCLDIVKKFIEYKNDGLGIRVFFFDEEEKALKGSTAYVNERGIADLSGLLNIEMVGLGDKLALWPVDDQKNGPILKAFEESASRSGILSKRIGKFVANTADHLPFLKAGLNDTFTISCISDKDIEAAAHYFKAMEFEVDKQTLAEIRSTAPIFEHYHKPTDTYEKLNDSSVSMASNVIWDTILTVQKCGS